MGTRFIDALNKRMTGLEYDASYYFDCLFSIMRNVYKTRYPHVYIPINTHDNQSKTEKANFVYENGTVIIDFDSFVSWCLDKLEEEKLEESAYFKNCKNDNLLAGYFFKAFENLLTDNIVKLTPGLEGRIKQIDKVLKEHCDIIKIDGKKCFKLRAYNLNHVSEPIVLEKLFDIAEKSRSPQKKYSKKMDAKNGPSIEKEQMRAYLLDILEQSGGLVFRNDLISLIKNIYGYKNLSMVTPSFFAQKDDKESQNILFEDFLSNPGSGLDSFCVGQDHYSMVYELYEKMDEKKKDVYYYRRVQGFTTQKTAKIMACAVGTISNIETAINQCISEYFLPKIPENDSISYKDYAIPEEVNAILNLLNHLLMEERMN